MKTYSTFELARETGLCRNTILKYEKKGIITSSRDYNNYRVFRRDAVNAIHKHRHVKQ